MDDRLVHLCNYSIQKTTSSNDTLPAWEDGQQETATVEGVPDISENMLSSRAFAQFVDAQYGAGQWEWLVADMVRE